MKLPIVLLFASCNAELYRRTKDKRTSPSPSNSLESSPAPNSRPNEPPPWASRLQQPPPQFGSAWHPPPPPPYPPGFYLPTDIRPGYLHIQPPHLRTSVPHLQTSVSLAQQQRPALPPPVTLPRPQGPALQPPPLHSQPQRSQPQRSAVSRPQRQGTELEEGEIPPERRGRLGELYRHPNHKDRKG